MPYSDFTEVLPYYAKIFVDPAAGSGGNGSEGSPYNTWAAAAAAVGADGTGKSVLVKAYPRGVSALTAQVAPPNGSASAPFILGAYGIDHTTGASHARLDGDGVASPLFFSASQHIVCQDFDVWGSTGSNSPVGTTSALCESLTFLRLHVGPADALDNSSSTMVIYGNNTRVLWCVIENAQADALWLKGSNLTVEDNWIRDQGLGTVLDGDGIQLADWGGTCNIRRNKVWTHRHKSAFQTSDCIADGGVLNVEDNWLWAAAKSASRQGARAVYISGTNNRTWTANFKRNRMVRGINDDLLAGATAEDLFGADTNGALTINLESNLFDGGSKTKRLVHVTGAGAGVQPVNSTGNTYKGTLPGTTYESMISVGAGVGTAFSLASVDDHFYNVAPVNAYAVSSFGGGSNLTTNTVVNGHFDVEYANMIELKGALKSTVAALNASLNCSGSTTGASLIDTEGQPRTTSPLLSGGTTAWRKNINGAWIYGQRGCWGRVTAA